jgi:tRNA threonylcarbamoyladenosine biosynthesis protein TsaB
MLILSLDTSTVGCSVALHREGELLALSEIPTGRSAASLLTTLIEQTTAAAGLSLAELDAVAVAKGPGSYTGLRVGVSTAKGLCFALDKPLIAINTLEAMVQQIRHWVAPDTLLCPMIDARRMEVYCLLSDAQGRELLPTQALVVQPDSFDTWLAQGPVVFFGDGAAKCQALLSHQPNARVITQVIAPSARTVGILATQAFREEHFENVASFEPYYLKDFVGTSSRSKVAL